MHGDPTMIAIAQRRDLEERCRQLPPEDGEKLKNAYLILATSKGISVLFSGPVCVVVLSLFTWVGSFWGEIGIGIGAWISLPVMFLVWYFLIRRPRRTIANKRANVAIGQSKMLAGQLLEIGI